MTRPSPASLSIVTAALAVAAFAFSIGVFVGQLRCANDLAVLRAEFLAHQTLPIHPGAVRSEVVRDLTTRVDRLERQGER